ncbi:hypothetical protein U9M48_004341 [Paspalum notatum var. saurae]|uniref:non-specific serine/threonine protein kinase n=1 Tax=Paspalum notatum var. saurae TaxID=547442 RepID=A0AAQ3PUV5_PASNO
MLPEHCTCGREDDHGFVDTVAGIFRACIVLVLPALTYLLGRSHGRINKRETKLARRPTKDAFTSEIEAYLFSPPTSLTNSASDMIDSSSRTTQEGTYVSTVQRTLSYGKTIEHKALEQLLIDGRAKPMMLSYEVLEHITNNFSEVIGSGGSGEVYMGFLENGNVAVKKLYNTDAFTEKQFEDELTCLIRVEHKNIVRLLGYCSDIQQKLVEYGGRHVLADIRRRFLCLEYAPNKSLDDYLKDECRGHDWDTRYQFIEGICQGLHYLHKKESITHMDLKPGNILLDANMVPKITDFGLSRRFSGADSRIITKHLCGSRGYIAPELLERGEISLKSDIFSLGIIIINILRGSTSLSHFENWHESLDVDCPRFKRCIEIAQLCVNDDPRKRPTMDYIMGMLNANEKQFGPSSVPMLAPPVFENKALPEKVKEGTVITNTFFRRVCGNR